MNSLDKLTKILTSEQIRQVDQFTIENQPISSIDLMEKASKAFVSWFLKKHGIRDNVKVLCGTGNNGGDGLAISRLLLEYGCQVETYFIGTGSNGTEDFQVNLNRLKKLYDPILIKAESDFPLLNQNDIIIDGIFGSGLSRPVKGLHALLINHINRSATNVIAIDIASGLYCDQNASGEMIVKCTETVTFQIPKLAFYLPQNDDFTGNLFVVDIGLDQNFIAKQKARHYLITPEFIKSIFKSRGKYAHKGNMGRNLIVSGSKGKIGAAVLASRACLRSGAGLVTVYLPECGYEIMQTAVPEAMVITDTHQNMLSNVPDVNQYDAIGVGPGIGVDKLTVDALVKLLKKVNQPMVLDADALNIIALEGLIDLIPEKSILTPHPLEFKRLVGNWNDDFERLEKQIEFSKRNKVVVILKGAHTSITSIDGQVFFNTTGNPGMATAGSGDVLTGIVTALLGQKYDSLEAAILGAYLHGLAGNLYVKENSEEGLIAGDLIDLLPKSFAEIREGDS
ncbi:NAD(P)H-hydrate dehydratase [Reichenbachiella sp. MALMAid0571]|uniref:NAD(P)H-hydrate dehydratase n=1 Tax=Reichenbachiella sp. MALMAid0571 TaxID=3143939 RepID=UPI0032E056D3